MNSSHNAPPDPCKGGTSPRTTGCSPRERCRCRRRDPYRGKRLVFVGWRGRLLSAEAVCCAPRGSVRERLRCSGRYSAVDITDAANYISSMMSFAPIIQEAWEHRRRRHQTIAAAALASAVTVGIAAGLASAGPGSPSGKPSSAPAIALAPSTVLSQAPYMGVSCPVANSIACDRVGLAVWLTHPALSVTAVIVGARLVLDYRGEFRYRGEKPRTIFDGFLQPASIVSRFHVHPVGHQMWFGDARDYPAPFSMRLTIHEPGGCTVITHTDVELSTGWG